jgi:ribonuclease HI
MKTLKFNHVLASQIASGEKTATWRVHDDKDIEPKDTLEVVDKVNATDETTWQRIGTIEVTEVIMKPLSAITDADFEGHERYESEAAMYDALKKYYGDDIGPSTVIKIIHFVFSAYDEPTSFVAFVNGLLQHAEVKIFTDGGSRGNPGPSASGYVIMDVEDTILERGGEYLGITTNNQAEYRAVRLALMACAKYGAVRVDAYMDSLLVVNQMKGLFKIKNRDLWPIYDDIKQLCKTFEKGVNFTHVPRELNKKADAEVNRILDEHSNK